MSEASKNLANLNAEAKRALLAKLLREKARAVETWQPISHNQKALWFLARLAPNSAAYNLLYAARISSQLNRTALQKALRILVQRYPILTSTYALKEGEPSQLLHPAQQIPLREIDASQWSLEEIQHQLHTESNQAINLEKGPVLQVLLYQRSQNDYVLALIAHHIAVDFWALDILVDELFILYAAEQAGVTAPLPAPGQQHSEYVRWQNEMIESPEGERHWAYWQKVLSGEVPNLHLPTDRPRPPVQTHKGASHSFALSPELAQRLKKLANEERVTLFTLMLTAYQTLLYRYTNQDDIIVGTPALGRTKAAWERVVDYLANPVLVRANMADNPTFKALLAQTREGVFAALDHQDFPFPLLVERLQPKRDPSYSPFYQTLFIWDRPRKRSNEDLQRLGQPELARKIAQEGLSFEPFAYGQQGAPFDLTLTIFEIDGNLSADFRYNVDLFDAATIARIEQHFQVLLNSIVEQPEQHLLSLPMLTEEERQRILIDWNATASDFPAQSTLHQLIEAQVERTPDAIAVLFNDQTRTYRELNNAANHLAHRLQELGVGADTLVGVCMERSIEMVEALLAVLKSGGAYVPMDPGYPAERLAYMLEDAQVPVLLTQPHLQEQLPTTSAQIIALAPNWDQGLRNEQTANPTSATGPTQLAYMIYTSGSTGKPKGVMNTHRGICNRLTWMQSAYKLTANDRVMQKTPFSFDVSVWEFFWPLLSGAGLVIARPGGHTDPTYIAQLIVEQQITTLHFVPSMLQMFLQEPNIERCSSLRQVVCSGEALTPEHVQLFFKRFPRNVELHNLYGPTEAAVDVTWYECSPADTDIVPIGRPIANTQIYILNPAQQPVPTGIAGELYIGGVNVARGYHNRPELTAEKFIDDPFSQQEGARLFRTADLARFRADGAIEFLGRIDHQVKIRGFRIELGEIESVLKQHSALQDAIVVAREDTSGNKRLVAYLVPRQFDEQPAVEELRAFLKEQLPDYMVPALFMYLEALPLSPNGKVDRKALPEPDTSRPDLQVAYVAPRTPTEQTLAAIWSQVLGIEKIGVNDNYFDLGGASIQSLEIVAQVTEAGLPLALEMLFEHQTVAELAAAIDARKAEQEQATLQPVEQSSEFNQTPIETVTPATVISEQAKTDMAQSYIESLGTYLPPKVVTSEELIAGCTTPIRFPMARLTGVKTRRMAGETEFSIDIAKQAVAACLANSKYNPEDIDMLICGNISHYNRPGLQFDFEPSMTSMLTQHFGFTNAIALDIDNACTGLFTAAYIIDSFIRAGLIRRGLAVTGEYISHLAKTAQKEIESFMDSRLACLTVGDAGAAIILEGAPDKKIGFHEYEMYSLGRYSEACIGKPTDKPHGGAIMYTDAVTVSAVNLKQAVSHAGLIIERSQWPKEAFQHILVHQTSKTTINDVPREINKYFGREVVDKNAVINNIAERGNTATTTHMIAIMDHIRSGHINAGDNAIFGITGSGATIGTALYTFDDLPDRIRRHESGEAPQKVAPTGKNSARLPANQRVRVASVGTVPADSTIEKKSIELIEAATKAALAQVPYDKSEIDLMIFSGIYRDEFISEPAIAALAQGRLGINDDIETQQDKKTFVLDVMNSSLGTLNAVHTAIGLIKAQRTHKALVVASEIENNRQSGIPEKGLVGIEETGSAILLEDSPDGKTGFGNFVFKAFPEYLELRRVHTVFEDSKMVMVNKSDPQLHQLYLRCIRETVAELLEIEQLELSRIKVILPPQISSDFINELSAELQVERERFTDVQPQHDLFTSSLAYALEHVLREQKAQAGDIGLIINVGAGIQVGCATYYF
jgi:amino acid adenylation domain-containing protein